MTVACVFENPDSLRNFSNSGRDGSSPSCNLDLTELINEFGLDGRPQLNLQRAPTLRAHESLFADRVLLEW